MTLGTIELIQTVTVGAGGSASIDFTSIPQSYDDLRIVMSARSTGTNANAQGFCYFAFNGSTSDFSSRRLIQDGSSLSLDTGGRFAAFIPNNSATANTFGTMVFYLTDYRSNNNKEYSVDQGMENNSTTAYLQGMQAGLWSNSAAITSISIGSVIDSNGASANFAQHTTATLYGITRIPSGAKAIGGAIYDDSSFFYHVFTSSGIFTPNQNLSCDVLAIGGGGGSGSGTNVGAGGGAGGLLYATSKSFASSTNFTVTIGAGGGPDGSGVNTTIDNITAFGGGRGGDESTVGGNGGSGGGSTWASGLNIPGTSTQTNNGGGTGYGNAGGSNTVGAGSNHYPSGGGGGAGAVGGNGTSALQGGNGGAGLGGNTLPALNAFGAATSTGVLSGGNYFYAGGGGGGSWQGSTTWSSGGIGGGGRGGANISGGDNPTDGLPNTGGGGGGNGAAAVIGRSGGSGIVIVRYAK
jgi:hypothetical protein